MTDKTKSIYKCYLGPSMPSRVLSIFDAIHMGFDECWAKYSTLEDSISEFLAELDRRGLKK